MDNQHTLVDSHELAWLAGIVDGEGCLDMSKIPYGHTIRLQTRVRVANTSELLMKRISNIAERLGIRFHISLDVYNRGKKSRANFKPVYGMEIQNQTNCKKIISAILPYLVLKDKQANLMLEFINSRINRGARQGIKIPYNKRELTIAQEMRILNQRGVTQTADHNLLAWITKAPE